MAKDDKPYTTKPTTQVDLESRLSDDYKPEGDLTSRNILNPNPFGEEAYVGTDPIYQNYADDTHKPLAAKSGSEKKAEEAFKAEFQVEKDEAVPDPGMGGVTTLADTSGPDPSDVTVGDSSNVHHANDESGDSNEEPADGPVTEEETSAGQQGPTPTPTQPTPAS